MKQPKMWMRNGDTFIAVERNPLIRILVKIFASEKGTLLKTMPLYRKTTNEDTGSSRSPNSRRYAVDGFWIKSPSLKATSLG